MSIEILREVLAAAPNNHYVVQTTVRYSTIRDALADHEAMREEAQRQTDRADAAEAKLKSMGVKPCPCLGISCLGCPDCGAVMGDATYREMFGDMSMPVTNPVQRWDSLYHAPIADEMREALNNLVRDGASMLYGGRMVGKSRLYHEFVGYDMAKPGSDKTVTWEYMTETEAVERARAHSASYHIVIASHYQPVIVCKFAKGDKVRREGSPHTYNFKTLLPDGLCKIGRQVHVGYARVWIVPVSEIRHNDQGA